MTNPRAWFAATTLLVGVLAPSMAAAASLPVKVEGFEGEVVQVSGSAHSGMTPGKALQSGTQVKTGRDGRADLSLNGVPTLRLGNDVDLLLHSMDQDVLRLRAASGALSVDTRASASGGAKSRDVRLNAGDLRLRIANAEAWIEVSERTGQVCVISGVIEAQQPSAAAVRLDTPGQCLRQSGQSAQWTMVPIDLLQVRVAATGTQRALAMAAEPVPPKPRLQIKLQPMPGTLPEGAQDAPSEPEAAPAPRKPPVVILQQAPTTSAVRLEAADPLEPPAVPQPPPPPPLPVAPPAASRLAMALPEPLEVPAVPDLPAPLPMAPAAAGTVAMKVAERVELPEIPDAPSVPAAPPQPAAVVAAPTGPVASVASPPEAAAAPAVSTEVAVAPQASVGPAAHADDRRRWRVVLGSMPEREKAELEAERLNARGWAVEAREYQVGERHGFRIGFGEFASREDAQKALEEFLAQHPDAPAWLAKY